MPTDSKARAAWVTAARTIIVYRDRYQITDDQALRGPERHSARQKIGAARALAPARQITNQPEAIDQHRRTAVANDGLHR